MSEENNSKNKPTRVKISDVAAAVGVATSTVSNAYNRPDQLSVALRQRILETAAQLGYAGPDPIASSLRRQQVGAIGILYGEQLSYAFNDPVAALVLRGIAGATEQGTFSLLLVPGLPVKEGETEMVSRALVDGFIVYSMEDNSPLVAAALRRKLPAVLVDQAPQPGLPFVGIADEGGARAAAQHLLDLGHRRFAVIVDRLSREPREGPANLDLQATVQYLPTRDRLRGYRSALSYAGIDWNTVTVYQCWNNSEEAARRAVRNLLAQPDRPTALLVATDRLAIGAIQAAQGLGLNVPGDLSVVGFDDVESAATLNPPLTTVRQSHTEKGRQAGKLLLSLLRGEPTLPSVILPTQLIIRASSGPCPA